MELEAEASLAAAKVEEGIRLDAALHRLEDRVVATLSHTLGARFDELANELRASLTVARQK